MLRHNRVSYSYHDVRSTVHGSDIMITVGDTVVSEHLALQDHQDIDVTFKLLDFERNWSKRKWKEKIAIDKLGPSLNGNEGHYISPIFDPVPSKYCADIGPRHVTTTTRGTPAVKKKAETGYACLRCRF